jgi:hypothetical protein
MNDKLANTPIARDGTWSVRNAAKRIGESEETINQWIEQGKIDVVYGGSFAEPEASIVWIPFDTVFAIANAREQERSAKIHASINANIADEYHHM